MLSDFLDLCDIRGWGFRGLIFIGECELLHTRLEPFLTCWLPWLMGACMDIVSGPITVDSTNQQETPSITDIRGVRQAQEPARNVAEAPPAGQPTVRLIAEAEAVDARSSQFQCKVSIENTGARPLQIVSIRDFAPSGTKVQQVIDTSQSEARERRDDLYRELSNLMTGHLLKTSEEYRAQLTYTMLVVHIKRMTPVAAYS
jgi:hypothetical protein